MALFKCPNCGEEISDRGSICPYCKNWINTEAYRQMASQKKQELMEEGEREYKQTTEYKRKKQREEKLAKLPPCPLCGSKENVKRIGTLNRAVSTYMWGLASSKIGKEYECTACKYRW